MGTKIWKNVKPLPKPITMNSMTTPERSVEEIVEELLKRVHFFADCNQYADGGAEEKAYLDGVQTALGMVYIDLTGTPKSKGMHPHQEDEEIASTILTLNTIATLRALIAEEEGRLKNRWGYSKEFREANSGYMVGIREHNEALKESIQLKEDIIKELEKKV